MSRYFKSPLEFSLMEDAIATVVSCLNTGRTKGLGSIAVHASSKGYRITLNRKVLACGSTPRALHENFTAAVAQAKKQKS